MRLIIGRKKIQLKAILCGCLIDGTGRPALHDATIIVEGDKISAVGRKP